MKQRILYIFTRTPLHIGAGQSVGAIDQPIIRERHTGFPSMPASGIKGVAADQWNTLQPSVAGKPATLVRSEEGRWIFGSDDAKNPSAGAVTFSDGRLLALPLRSAKGSFGWITSPLILRRAVRDGVILHGDIPTIEPQDTTVLTPEASMMRLPNGKVVLEEYCFDRCGDGKSIPDTLLTRLAALLTSEAAAAAADPVWSKVSSRLVIVSDGMMSFFAQNACEVAQHVRIEDATGTAANTGLFNQENVPSETLFYSVLTCSDGRGAFFQKEKHTSADALEKVEAKLKACGGVLQFGGDSSTGLGFCSLNLRSPATAQSATK